MSGPLATTWRALGTSATVAVAEPRRLAAAVAAVRTELAMIDAACSRFRDDAELVALNASGGRRVQVSPLLFEALEVAVEAARATGGAVDPTVGAALERVGYDCDLAEIAPDGPPLPDVWAPDADWRSIVLDGTSRSVLMPSSVRLDLGATAKALAADRGAAAAASATGTGVVVSLGGDVAVGGRPPAAGWPVALGDDHAAPNGPVVALADGGLATSSTTVRRWRRGDQVVHHILDPATGTPCQVVWRTVTVAASTCVQANVASTAAIVLGAKAPDWLARRRLPARLVRPSGEVETVAGWLEEAA